MLGEGWLPEPRDARRIGRVGRIGAQRPRASAGGSLALQAALALQAQAPGSAGPLAPQAPGYREPEWPNRPGQMRGRMGRSMKSGRFFREVRQVSSMKSTHVAIAGFTESMCSYIATLDVLRVYPDAMLKSIQVHLARSLERLALATSN